MSVSFFIRVNRFVDKSRIVMIFIVWAYSNLAFLYRHDFSNLTLKNYKIMLCSPANKKA